LATPAPAPTLTRTESGIQPITPPLSDEEKMPPPPPTTPKRKKRRVKHKRPNQGDTPHLQNWREFYKKWHTKHAEAATNMKHIEKARAAGVAYRHSTGKKRASDPAEPEFPFDHE